MLFNFTSAKKQNKRLFFRHIKAEIIYQHKICITRTVKDSFPQERMIPNGNLDLHEGMKSPGNKIYVGKYNVSHFYIPLSHRKLFKAKILIT